MNSLAGPSLLAGWGLTAASRAQVADPPDYESVCSWLKAPPNRGVIARGLARSYGDAAQNAGGVVIRTGALNSFLDIDLSRGEITVGSGVTIDQIINKLLPFGFFVPVTPGTRYVSVGGAIASDVHGKNHHVSGTFTRHVRALLLALPDGSLRAVSPGDDPELFWATVGGMGLTGVIVQATLALKRVESSLVTVDTERVPNLETLLQTLTETDHRYPYSVAWIDTLARGASLGRAVLTRGDFASYDSLPPARRVNPYEYRGNIIASAPAWFPKGALNRLTVSAFNELWFRKAPKRRVGELQTIPTFFHPLDMIDRWNVIYGRGGFVQYQFVVPYGAEEMIKRTVERLSSTRIPSFLAVLKRFGDINEAPLSFPTAGWTMALDMSATLPGLAQLLDELDQAVVAAGGRVYLTKDSRLRPEFLEVMYPRLDEWRELRERIDPNRTMMSDLSRRLSL